MIVDAHVHSFVFEEFPPGERWSFANRWGWLGPPSSKAFKNPKLPSREQHHGPFRDPASVYERTGVGTADPDAEVLIKHMDSIGVDKCVAMMVDWGLAWGEQAKFDIEEVNEHAGELKKKHAGRYFFCLGVDPRRRSALDIAEKALRDHGASGIKLLAANGFSPDDPICFPIYELASQYEVPIVIHTGSGDVASFVEEAHPWRVEEPAKLFPKLQFVLAHAGGGIDGLWREVLTMTACVPNIAVDLAEWQYPIAPSNLDPGREQEFIHVLNIFRRRIGAHNVLLGTDFMPGHSVEVDKFFVDIFQNLPERAKKFGYHFSEEEAEAMRGENAMRIFALE